VQRNKYFIVFAILCCLFLMKSVNASTYTPTSNLLSQNNYVTTLIDMAYNDSSNFLTKKFAIFQIDYDYYLVFSDNISFLNNSITFNNSTIYLAHRSNESYNYYYTFSKFNESDTTVNLSYIVFSNVNATNTINSSYFSDYKFNYNIINLGIFVLALLFAIFVTKERSF
jgi:hypothetical protein